MYEMSYPRGCQVCNALQDYFKKYSKMLQTNSGLKTNPKAEN